MSQLWASASKWLASHGSDQWQYPANENRITDDIENGKVFVAVPNFMASDSELFGTITLDVSPDPEFWEDADGGALYVRRMITAPAARGHDLGSALIDWAAGRALLQPDPLPVLRLDAWKTNEALHAYYTGQGFRRVRTVRLAHRRSGELFERPTAVRSYKGPLLHDIEHPSVDADFRGTA
ncbi:GNAT family N-acetyltransferase [Streptomyces bohaiensis]|uniref:GNAT family N-acetyltransferase n=1 Tax=Streptomyces bohaiensis TaxID=1431344 RepID=A0ABX1C8F1_9ACTN|nr:GNAT family N-acetyltransferase [Streptomyces bohaiensis]